MLVGFLILIGVRPIVETHVIEEAETTCRIWAKRTFELCLRSTEVQSGPCGWLSLLWNVFTAAIFAKSQKFSTEVTGNPP